MSTPDRNHPTPREIYYAARRVAHLLPEDEREELMALLKRGYKGENVHHTALRILSRSPQAREWLNAALYGPVPGMRGFAHLPGHPGPIAARSLWRCPQCGFQWRVLRKGRPVPPCPHDGAALYPVTETKHD